MNTFKKALLTTSIGLALSFGAGQTHAALVDLSGAGPISIKFDFYSAECSSITSTCYGGNVDNPNPLMPPGTTPGNGTFNETTFGLGRITTIAAEPGSNPILFSAAGGEQLVIFLYGVADSLITGPDGAGNFNIYNTGCQGGDCDGLIHLDIYQMTTAEFKGFTGSGGWSTADRTSFDVFTGVTNKTLWAATTFTQGARGIDGVYDLVQTTRSSTLPTTGSGAWLGDCVSGPACDYLNSNSYPAGNGKMADLFGEFTLQVAAPALQAKGWLGYNNDPILATASAVPEPGILSLFGGALLGMSLFRRFASRSS